MKVKVWVLTDSHDELLFIRFSRAEAVISSRRFPGTTRIVGGELILPDPPKKAKDGPRKAKR